MINFSACVLWGTIIIFTNIRKFIQVILEINNWQLTIDNEVRKAYGFSKIIFKKLRSKKWKSKSDAPNLVFGQRYKFRIVA